MEKEKEQTGWKKGCMISVLREQKSHIFSVKIAFLKIEQYTFFGSENLWR